MKLESRDGDSTHADLEGWAALKRYVVELKQSIANIQEKSESSSRAR